MSAWVLVLLAVGGSCATIAVNVVVIAHIYGKKEAKWDAFCEQSKENRRELDALKIRFAAHTRIANGYNYGSKYD